MKKIVLIVMAVTAAVSVMAEISDNFAKAGVGVGGSIAYYSTSYNPLNEDDDMKSTYTSFSFRPSVEIMAMDNLSISLNPAYRYYNFEGYDADGNVDYENPDMTLSLSIGASYYLVSTQPLVPFLGASYSISYQSELDGMSGGEEITDQESSIDYDFYVNGGALYFLNDNLALRCNLSVGFLNEKDLTDEDGNDVEYLDDYDSSEWMDISTNLWFGISYFFPNKNTLLVAEL